MGAFETWKDIPEYEGIYQASTLGRIRDSNNVIMEIKSSNNDRPYVSNLGVLQNIIALTFLGGRPKKYETCHGDGNSFNNNISNLRYDTRSENRIDNYRYGSKTGGGLFSILEVLFIREIFLTTTHTVSTLSKIFNTGTGNISNIIKRKTFAWLNDDGSIRPSTTAITYNLIITNKAKQRVESHSDNSISLDNSILDFITVVNKSVESNKSA